MTFIIVKLNVSPTIHPLRNDFLKCQVERIERDNQIKRYPSDPEMLKYFEENCPYKIYIDLSWLFKEMFNIENRKEWYWDIFWKFIGINKISLYQNYKFLSYEHI